MDAIWYYSRMFDLVSIVKAAGYFGLFAIIFAETGLFFGFFLPGDSLLFTAGFLASQSFLSIWPLTIMLALAAILGDSTGYAFGAKLGHKIFYKADSFFFNKANIDRAKMFFEKHGRKTIILARFIPVLRTFVPILAGVGRMHYRVFLTYNVMGGLLWGAGVTLLGYFLGNTIPHADRYLLPIIAAIIFVSLLPTFVHLWRDPKFLKALRDKIYAAILKK